MYINLNSRWKFLYAIHILIHVEHEAFDNVANVDNVKMKRDIENITFL